MTNPIVPREEITLTGDLRALSIRAGDLVSFTHSGPTETVEDVLPQRMTNAMTVAIQIDGEWRVVPAEALLWNRGQP